MPRCRPRLRSGKLVSTDGQWLADCRIVDRAEGGAGLVVATDAHVPQAAWLYDDETTALVRYRTVWQQGSCVGGAIGEPPNGMRARAIRRSLGTNYHACQGA